MQRRQFLRSLAVAAVVASFAALDCTADITSYKLQRVSDGEIYSLTTTQNNASTSALLSQVFFEGSGTLRLSGSGITNTVKTMLVATNGTLTIDVSGVTFSDSNNRVLELVGGIYCGEKGKLVVSGVDKLVIGDVSNMMFPVCLPEVELNGAALSFRAMKVYKLPDRNIVAWSYDNRAPIQIQAANPLAQLAENNVITWDGSVTLAVNEAIPEGYTLRDTRGWTVSSPVVTLAPSYAPTKKGTDKTGPTPDGNPYTAYHLSWGGVTATLRGDLRVNDGSAVGTSIRGYKMYGDIEGGYLVIGGSKATSAGDAFDFYGDINLKHGVEFKKTDNSGQWARFFGVCFTNGVALNFNGTNNTMFIEKKLEVDYVPNFTTLAFDAEQPVYNQHSAIVVSNLTVKIGTLTQGTGIIRGNGTVKLGGITGNAKLLVEPGLTIVKDPDVAGGFCSRVDSTPIEGKTYTTYFGGNADGMLDLNTYEGTEPITAGDGLSILGSTNAAPAEVAVAGSRVTLRAPGDTWNDNAKISHWFDFSDFSTYRQVTATVDPPTSVGGAGSRVLSPEECGPKAMNMNVVGKTTYYPAVEAIYDVRGNDYIANRLYNNRMYQNFEKTGTNEWWESGVYLCYVTNDTRYSRSYLSAGKESGNTGRRIAFSPQVARSKWKSVTMVFGSQNGGGAALLSMEQNALWREKGIDNPITTNSAYRIIVDGVEVDPTVAKFNGGWQVITIQTTNDYQKTINGLGYSQVRVDGGGQNYGEMVIYNSLPTEAERIAIEQYLATKWGIAYNGHKAAKFNLSGTGSTAISNGVYEIGGTFSGTADIGNAKVTYSTTGSSLVSGYGWVVANSRGSVPSFAADFQGIVELGADAWNFTVNSTDEQALNAIDIGQAQFLLPEGSVTVGLTVDGELGRKHEVTLAKGGGFIGAPTWSASFAAPYEAKSERVVVAQGERELKAQLPSGSGLMIILR